jgi:hypothetical protein
MESSSFKDQADQARHTHTHGFDLFANWIIPVYPRYPRSKLGNWIKLADSSALMVGLKLKSRWTTSGPLVQRCSLIGSLILKSTITSPICLFVSVRLPLPGAASPSIRGCLWGRCYLWLEIDA